MGGGGTQCGGSLNITATAGANGNGIRWTDNNSTTSPRSVSTTGTYYAVTTSTAGCESGTAPVSVTINAVPNITRAGGDASQTVNQNTAISAITYTASNATGISLSSGSLPAGVNGTPNGVAFTISGTPSDAGTFNYSVTATHTNGCASTAFSGAITVNAVATTPPNAASTQTWTYGTQTWSDRIVAAPSNCYNKTSLSTTTYVNVEYRIKDGRYYYTWNCAAQNHTTFCPDPWRIPDQSDAYTLSTTINGVSLLNAWGLGGRAVGSNIEDDKTNGYVWTKTSHSSYTGYAYMLGWGGEYISSQQNPQYSGMQVRCVK
jgi:hypothetical protein